MSPSIFGIGIVVLGLAGLIVSYRQPHSLVGALRPASWFFLGVGILLLAANFLLLYLQQSMPSSEADYTP